MEIQIDAKKWASGARGTPKTGVFRHRSPAAAGFARMMLSAADLLANKVP